MIILLSTSGRSNVSADYSIQRKGSATLDSQGNRRRQQCQMAIADTPINMAWKINNKGRALCWFINALKAT